MNKGSLSECVVFPLQRNGSFFYEKKIPDSNDSRDNPLVGRLVIVEVIATNDRVRK